MAARSEHLLGHQHRKRRPHRATDDTELKPLILKPIEVGVVAGPAGMAGGLACSDQVTHHIAVGVKDTYLWDCTFWNVFLPPGLAQQILRRKF
jgi:hypothetical protein